MGDSRENYKFDLGVKRLTIRCDCTVWIASKVLNFSLHTRRYPLSRGVDSEAAHHTCMTLVHLKNTCSSERGRSSATKLMNKYELSFTHN